MAVFLPEYMAHSRMLSKITKEAATLRLQFALEWLPKVQELIKARLVKVDNEFWLTL